MVKIMSLKQFEKPFVSYVEEGFEFDRSFTAQQKLGKDVVVKHSLAWSQGKGMSKMSFSANKINFMTSGKVDIDQNGKLSSFEVGGKTQSLWSVTLRGNETNRTQIAVSGEVYKLKLSGDVDIVDFSSGSAGIARNENKVAGSINITKKQGSVSWQHKVNDHHIVLIGCDYGSSDIANTPIFKTRTDTSIHPDLPKSTPNNGNTVKLSFGHELYNLPSASSRKTSATISSSVQFISSKAQHFFSPNSVELCTHHHETGYFGGLSMKQAASFMSALEKSMVLESTIGWAAKDINATDKDKKTSTAASTAENESNQDIANSDEYGDNSLEVKSKKNKDKDKRSPANGPPSQVALTLRSQFITPHGLDLFFLYNQGILPSTCSAYCAKVSVDMTKKQLGGDLACQFRRVDADNKKNSWKLKTRIKVSSLSVLSNSKVAFSIRREQQISLSLESSDNNGGSCWLRMAVELPVGLIDSGNTKDVRIGFGVGVSS